MNDPASRSRGTASQPGEPDPVVLLWQQWQQGQQPQVRTFLARFGKELPPGRLAALLRVDQRERWNRGQRIPVEDYFRDHPQLLADAEAALDLVYAEFDMREERGEAPTLDEYLRRFPTYAGPLREQMEVRLGIREYLDIGAGDKGQPVGSGQPSVLANYEILEELGQGATGVVYKARDPLLRRIVALKRIHKHHLLSGAAQQRFCQEARSAGRLDHPNIVPIYQLGQHEGQSFFTMAYVPGPNLSDWVKTHGLPSPAAAAMLLQALADAIAYAHKRGVIHRDLKPENILMDLQVSAGEGLPRPRIADFGLAKLVQARSGSDGSLPGTRCQPSATMSGNLCLTVPGQILGTPAYMAPEQAAGHSARVGPAADIYSLGGLLYFLLTGQPPLPGRGLSATLGLVGQQPPTPPRQLNPQIPAELEAICLTCLEKDPARRYSSASALARDLGALASRLVRHRKTHP